MTAEEMLAADAVPEGVSPALRAVWHGLREEWEAAHALVQDEPGHEAAWVHAWLHRIEGDLGNAGYWYRRANREMPRRGTATDSEGHDIAGVLFGL